MEIRPFSLASLLALAGPYFEANSDVAELVATTHDGTFYRPENRRYAEGEAAKAESTVQVITRADYEASLEAKLTDEQPIEAKPTDEQATALGSETETKKKGPKKPAKNAA